MAFGHCPNPTTHKVQVLGSVILVAAKITHEEELEDHVQQSGGPIS